jgi:hypothetical protein
MAIGLLSVLKMVPWGDVISNAPKIADGAMKLWRVVARKQQPSEFPASSVGPALTTEVKSLAILQAQLVAAEAKIADLHNQMLVSSELINALADQNTQLIKRFEINRMRVLWLAGGMVILGVVAAINIVIALAR